MPARKAWLGLMIMAAARPIAHKALTVMAMACANPTTPKNAPRISPAIQLPANACRPVCGHQSHTTGCACPCVRRERSAIFAIQHYACRHLQLASKAMKKSAVAVCQFAIKVCNVTPMVTVCQSLAPMVAIQIYVANASSQNAQKVHGEMTEANACHPHASAIRVKRASMDSARLFAELACRVMPKAIVRQINPTAHKASA